MKNKKNLLWDLDGTLTDPKEGIVNCIQYALEKSSRPIPADDDLLWCIGPPLYESFAKLAGNAPHEDVLKLVALYRERYSGIGIFENRVYEGISETLKNLGVEKQQFLATSKPHVYARKILDHFNLSHFFKAIHGSELTGERTHKCDLIKYILDQEDLNPGETVMIGDRKHDIIGAKACGVQSIGIAWGYGSIEELSTAGADLILTDLNELVQLLAQ